MTDEKEIFHNCHCHGYVMGEIQKRIDDNSDLFNITTDMSDENIARDVAKKQYAIMELVELKENL